MRILQKDFASHCTRTQPRRKRDIATRRIDWSIFWRVRPVEEKEKVETLAAFKTRSRWFAVRAKRVSTTANRQFISFVSLSFVFFTDPNDRSEYFYRYASLYLLNGTEN